MSTSTNFKATALLIAGTITKTTPFPIPFSEVGSSLFADFAWDIGRAVSSFRKECGWQSSVIFDLLEVVQEELNGPCPLTASDLFHFCDFYIGCSRISKAIWSPCKGQVGKEQCPKR